MKRIQYYGSYFIFCVAIWQLPAPNFHIAMVALFLMLLSFREI